MKMLWAVKIGDEDWQEQIITTEESRIASARAWATAHGFDRFRVSNDDGAPPSFGSNLLNRKRKNK